MIKQVKKKGYKRKPKNKNEIDSFSGVLKKKKVVHPEKKLKVDFEFVTLDGQHYKGGQGRLKVDLEGGVSFLLKGDISWKSLKGNLLWIRIKKNKYE